KVGGSAVFWAALAAQATVLIIFFLGKAYPAREIGYLWLNPIGCAACVAFSLVLQALIGGKPRSAASTNS
ncbi:MAG: Sodium/glucose cotransporter, partial [Verrucomicrobiota bacterium]